MTPSQTMHYFKFIIDLHCVIQPKFGNFTDPWKSLWKFIENSCMQTSYLYVEKNLWITSGKKWKKTGYRENSMEN